MTTQLTPLEIEVLKGICESEYQGSRNPINNPIWSWSIRCSIKGKQLSGVCGSLAKKGLVGSKEEGRDSAIWVTEDGFSSIMPKL